MYTVNTYLNKIYRLPPPRHFDAQLILILLFKFRIQPNRWWNESFMCMRALKYEATTIYNIDESNAKTVTHPTSMKNRLNVKKGKKKCLWNVSSTSHKLCNVMRELPPNGRQPVSGRMRMRLKHILTIFDRTIHLYSVNTGFVTQPLRADIQAKMKQMKTQKINSSFEKKKKKKVLKWMSAGI